jgi:thiosulfate/3-mercaptopyruvate sulfurtransferase
MNYITLISTQELAKHLDDPNWAVFDCRFDLANPSWGQTQYLKSHLPGAIYAHLDHDLSAPVIPGKTGRHPLPSIEDLRRTFSRFGIDKRVQVVAYDNYPEKAVTGAARLWWLLRWLGHPAVAVLDGGWQAWEAEDRPVSTGEEKRTRRSFVPDPHPQMLASVQEVNAWRANPAYRLVDSRSADRFRGENETIDPVAGHIPGAISAPFAENYGLDGRFLTVRSLKARFQSLLGNTPPEKAVFYCGSGVTAVCNLLAFTHAGMGEARLYAGSWSEWITDPNRPVATGDI